MAQSLFEHSDKIDVTSPVLEDGTEDVPPFSALSELPSKVRGLGAEAISEYLDKFTPVAKKHHESLSEEDETIGSEHTPILQSTPVENRISDAKPGDLVKSKVHLSYENSLPLIRKEVIGQQDGDSDSGSDFDETPSKPKAMRNVKNKDIKDHSVLEQLEELRKLKKYLSTQDNGKLILENFENEKNSVCVIKKEEMEKLKESIVSKERIIDELKKEKNEQLSLNDSQSKNISRLEIALKEESQTMGTIRQQNDFLSSENDSLKLKLAKLEAELVESDSTIKTLHGDRLNQKNETTKTISDLRGQISDFQNTVSGKDDDIKQLQERIECDKSEIMKTSETLKALETRLTSLESEIVDRENVISSHERSILDLTKNIELLQLNNKNLEESRETMMKKEQNTQQDYKKLLSELEKISKSEKNLDLEVQSLVEEQKVTRSKTEITRSESLTRYNELLRKNEGLQVEIETLNKYKADLQKKYDLIRGDESARLTRETSDVLKNHYDLYQLSQIDTLSQIEAQNIIKNVLVQFKVSPQSMKHELVMISRARVFSRVFKRFFIDVHLLIYQKPPIIVDYDSVEYDHIKLCAQALYNSVEKKYTCKMKD